MRRGVLLIVAMAVVGITATAHADPCAPRGGKPGEPVPKIIPVAHGSIKVDGVLDDPTWASACFIDDFEQKQPKFRAKPSHRVIAAVAIDGDTLYVGARMWADKRDDIDDALTQRDDTSQAERYIVSLDPGNTKRLAYSFAATAAGVRADWIHTDDSEGNRDMSWNPVWTTATVILPDGWSVEMAIPLNQLRLPTVPSTSWGINFNWYVPHLNEDVFWHAVPPEKTAWASYFGALTDLPVVRPSLAIELLPYLSARTTIDESLADPLAHRFAAGFDAGIDVKLTPKPGLTILGTLNPDFGQVDADPAFVNLTQYEVLLPERRPFFIENAPLFSDAGGNYFYSRRIGGLPLVQPSADEIVTDGPVRILGASTVSGYLAPRTQIAGLAAVTDETSAAAVVNGQRTTLVVSPLTGWAVARVEHQDGASVIGATATAVGRALGGTGLEDLLAKTAVVGGGDARLRTKDLMYELDLWAGATDVAGDTAAMTLLQESAAHEFQRPDQTHVHLDPNATNLAGWHAGAVGSKRNGTWQGTLLFNAESPGFELNDLGTLQSADDLDLETDLSRNVFLPGAHLFAWDVDLATETSWNFGGARTPTYLHTDVNATTLKFNNADVELDAWTPGNSDSLTRGGPQMQIGWREEMAATASTPSGRAFQLSGRVEGDLSETLQQGVIGSASLAWRVTPALRLDIAPTLTLIETHRQYLATVTGEGGGDETYGARYLFGHLHRHEASVVLRGTWSLSPDLVFTLYAQPFASVGHYDQIGELAAAGSSDIRWYDSTTHNGALRTVSDGLTGFNIAEPDFTVLSLRSTAVLRWEFRPGSTLYVVWQQQRAGSSFVEQPLHVAAPDVVTQPGIHTFAIKLSYWFG